MPVKGRSAEAVVASSERLNDTLCATGNARTRERGRTVTEPPAQDQIMRTSELVRRTAIITLTILAHPRRSSSCS